MGAFRFERRPPVDGSNKNVLEFDSSAELALSRAYGWDINRVELRETGRTDKQVDFDIYAAEWTPEGEDPRPLEARGVLKCLTRLECRRQFDEGLPFGVRRHQ